MYSIASACSFKLLGGLVDTHSETAGLMISHIAFIKSDHIHVHCALYKCITHTCTVEPPNMHNSTLYTIFYLQREDIQMYTYNNGQNYSSQCIRYLEVPLYIPSWSKHILYMHMYIQLAKFTTIHILYTYIHVCTCTCTLYYIWMYMYMEIYL